MSEGSTENEWSVFIVGEGIVVEEDFKENKTIADRNKRQSEGREMLASFPMRDVVPCSSDRKDERRVVEEERYPTFAMRRLRCLPPESISGEEWTDEKWPPPGSISGEEGKEEN